MWLVEYQHPRTVPQRGSDVVCTVPEGYRPSPGARYEGVVMDNNLSLGVLAIGIVGNANVELRTLSDEIIADAAMRGFVCWPY